MCLLWNGDVGVYVLMPLSVHTQTCLCYFTAVPWAKKVLLLMNHLASSYSCFSPYK